MIGFVKHVNRFKRLGINVAIYSAIIVATLAAVDLVTIMLGVFPPRHNYGHPKVGWVPARPTGEMYDDRCVSPSTGEEIQYARNEDAIRTGLSARELRGPGGGFEVAVGGDSHTDLCATNPETHFGVLERELVAKGVEAAVYAYGGGKYSPLQAYLAIKNTLEEYEPDAFVLNFYSGNDFYDMFRVDDRPHFVPAEHGYEIAPPVWYQLDEPGIQRRSRVLFALRSAAKRLGVWGGYVRLRYLRRAAAEQGRGFASVVAYMNDLRKSAASDVGYRAALAAQMLNQQLFFHRFPGSREESVERVRALLELVRTENPGLLLILSPVPSYQLVQQEPVDEVLLRTLDRLPITYLGGVREESELYETLRQLAAETGWLFIDNLTPLGNYSGSERLYNEFDYHIRPAASEIIGRTQAAVIARHALSRPAKLERGG